MESIDGLALAAIEEAKELVDESVEAFKNGSSERENVWKVAYAFYALPHKMKEKDQKLFAEFIDAKLDWDVPFTMRFTNRMSWMVEGNVGRPDPAQQGLLPWWIGPESQQNLCNWLHNPLGISEAAVVDKVNLCPVNTIQLIFKFKVLYYYYKYLPWSGIETKEALPESQICGNECVEEGNGQWCKILFRFIYFCK